MTYQNLICHIFLHKNYLIYKFQVIFLVEKYLENKIISKINAYLQEH
jgi:hypothetical protein